MEYFPLWLWINIHWNTYENIIFLNFHWTERFYQKLCGNSILELNFSQKIPTLFSHRISKIIEWRHGKLLTARHFHILIDWQHENTFFAQFFFFIQFILFIIHFQKVSESVWEFRQFVGRNSLFVESFRQAIIYAPYCFK